ncbi:MAG: aldehyde dehydrogenase family protein [Candidatus Schekmanbacteria bacterium]|nr:MAG: aldehyde dehydrogenase family protein [Candidatus Schekmanbacteria bacterium]
MAFKNKMLIGNKWISKKETFPVINPYNGKFLAAVPAGDSKDVSKAIETAERTFKKFKDTPAHIRASILEKTAEIISKNADDIARTISLESGKAITYSRAEVARSIDTFKFSAEEAKRIHGETVPMDASSAGEKRLGFYIRLPKGVIAAISPFNFPLNLVAHKVGPAIAAGNCVVLKPASTTPLTALKLGEIMLKAGLPAGVLNIVTGSGSRVGNPLVEDERISMITFTGSMEVGKRIKEKSGLKFVTLELGSNSAVVIDEGVEYKKAIPRIIVGAYYNSGQTCISVQRIYVHKSFYKKFISDLKDEVKKIKVGNPLNNKVLYGPLIEEKEAIRVEDWISEAKKCGAKLITGGERKKAIISPTVLSDTSAEMKVVKDEIFAPVVSVMPFDSFDEGLSMANDSIYGLNGGVYTNKIERAIEAIKEYKVGSLMINDIPTFRVDHMPYGGVRASGIGREGPKYAIEEMTDIKMVSISY